MTAKQWFAVALVVWATAFAGSFVAWYLTEPVGSGFTRGSNRAGVFLTWQAVAAVLALVVLKLGRGQARASFARRVSYVPLASLGLWLLGVALVVAFGILTGS